MSPLTGLGDLANSLVAAAAPELITLAALMTAGSVLLLIAVGASISGLYLVTCRIWPFRACGRCKGLGRLHAPNGKAWRDCPRCKGTGRRLRIGRRFWNHAERARRNAI